jgi:hypothetical protein
MIFHAGNPMHRKQLPTLRMSLVTTDGTFTENRYIPRTTPRPSLSLQNAYTRNSTRSPGVWPNFLQKNYTPVKRISFNGFIKYCSIYGAVTRLRLSNQLIAYQHRNPLRPRWHHATIEELREAVLPRGPAPGVQCRCNATRDITPLTSTEERCFLLGPLIRSTELGGFEYLHRSLVSRRRRRKGNPVPGAVPGPPSSWGI